MAFQVQQYGIPNKRVLQTSTETAGNILGGECMHGNCCKQKIQNNKKIKVSQKLLGVKEYTYVEGPTNCKAATSTTRQCNNNDNNNNIKERLVWSG